MNGSLSEPPDPLVYCGLQGFTSGHSQIALNDLQIMLKLTCAVRSEFGRCNLKFEAVMEFAVCPEKLLIRTRQGKTEASTDAVWCKFFRSREA